MPAPMNDDRSLFTLVGELPDRVSDLVKAEIDQIKAEISYKLKHFGVGSGLFAGAAVVGVFLLFTLIVAAIFALALVMPAWAAALTVSGILVVIIAILVWIADHQLQARQRAARIDREPAQGPRHGEGNGRV